MCRVGMSRCFGNTGALVIPSFGRNESVVVLGDLNARVGN